MNLIATFILPLLLLHRVLRAFKYSGVADVLRTQRIAEAIFGDHIKTETFCENKWRFKFLFDRDCDPLRTHNALKVKRILRALCEFEFTNLTIKTLKRRKK